MDTPKNITQVGEWDHNCKIYVEDYVVSYMRQLNFYAHSKEMAVAVYGNRKEEDGTTYVFLYGAGKLDLLQKDTRHLSQAQRQEIERIRRKYFNEFEFQGYRILNGEMVEGFHICEDDVCRYIAGYAQFYEKNESMLNFMLEARNEEPKVEEVEQEKFEEIKRRQDERKKLVESDEEERLQRREKILHLFHTENSFEKAEPAGQAGMEKHRKLTGLAVLGGLCIVGFSMYGRAGSLDGMKTVWRESVQNLSEQKLSPVKESTEAGIQVDSLIPSKDLEIALQRENKLTDSGRSDLEQAEPVINMQEEVATPEPVVDMQEEAVTSEPAIDTREEAVTPEIEIVDSENEVNPENETPINQETGITNEVTSEETYTIEEGDTLMAISLKRYGSLNKVEEICERNQIDNPDEIKIGQKIMLP